jgi:D-glycero-alpha-D-manno-heptose-7-phosphate kinase
MREHVGSQDQVIAAFGGLNRINFSSRETFEVVPVIVPEERLSLLQDSLMLFFTGISRNASDIAAEQIKATERKGNELSRIQDMVEEAIAILLDDGDLEPFGELLHEGWMLKRSLTDKISTSRIDAMYEAARHAGATGGKLLGAGGGGFLLLFVRPEARATVARALNGLLRVPVQFESSGSRIIFYEPDGYEPTPRRRRRTVTPARLAQPVTA